MKNLTIGILLGFLQTSWGQSSPLAVSPVQIKYRIRSSAAFPSGRTLYPPKKVLSLQVNNGGLQPWSVTISGALATACQGPCIRVSEEFSSTDVSSGSGARRVALNWLGSGLSVLQPGNYSGTVSFTPTLGGAAVSTVVSLSVAGSDVTPAQSEVKATAKQEIGCVNPAPADYSYAARCTIPDEAPTSDPALTQPPVGQTFTDPSFGGKIRRITGSGCSTSYGSTTAFSARSTYTLNTCGIYRTANAAQVRSTYPGNISFNFMSGLDDETYFYMEGSRLRSYNWVKNQDTILGNFSAAPYNFQTLYAGGSAGGSDDDWIVFYDYDGGPFPKICAVDVPALRQNGTPSATNTYCTVYQGEQPIDIADWVGISEVDGPTGKRFVYFSAAPISVVFSVGAKGSGELKQEYIVPEWPGWGQNNDDGFCLPFERCYSAYFFSHSALFRDRDSQVHLFANFEDIWPDRDYVSTYRLNAGRQILRPQEEGGGLKLLGLLGFDRQPGCSSAIGGCVLGPIERGLRFAARVTAAIPGTGNTTLTLSASSGWTVGTVRPVRIQNGANAWTCLNGGWAATVLAGNQVEIAANCLGATGALSQTMLGDASAYSTQTVNRSQIQIWRPGRQLHRVGMHRSVVWNDVAGTGISAYDTTARASLSRDGRYVAFTSNWGSLDFNGSSVYVAETSLGAPEESIVLKEVNPGRDRAAISYDVASGRSCLVELSSKSSFETLTESFTEPAGPISRLSYLGRNGALTPSTNYWVRLQCGLEVESRAFRTLPAGTAASAKVSVQVGPPDNPGIVDALVEYRSVGTTNFTATAAQPCSGGCRLDWTGPVAGVSEYRIVYRDSASNISATSDLFTITHNR